MNADESFKWQIFYRWWSYFADTKLLRLRADAGNVGNGIQEFLWSWLIHRRLWWRHKTDLHVTRYLMELIRRETFEQQKIVDNGQPDTTCL